MLILPSTELQGGHPGMGYHEHGSLWVMSCGDIITFVPESPPHVFTWQRLRSVTPVGCQK